MASNLQSLFEKIKIDSSTVNFLYIYYDKKDGTIHKISPKKDTSEYEVLEVDQKTAKHFLTGEKKTDDYKVAYDVSTKTVTLRHINDKNSLLTYDKILYQIPKDYNDTDLVVEQDLKNSVWNISINSKTSNFLTTYGLSLYGKILLSITKKDDPNILLRSLYVDIGVIVERTVSFPFKFEFEFNGSSVSIYTNKYFSSYNYKVVG